MLLDQPSEIKIALHLVLVLPAEFEVVILVVNLCPFNIIERIEPLIIDDNIFKETTDPFSVTFLPVNISTIFQQLLEGFIVNYLGVKNGISITLSELVF